MMPDRRGARRPRLSWRRGLGLAVLLFVTVDMAGTLGYIVIEGWPVWDAFYMTMISVTTVGFREVHDMSTVGQAWTILVTLTGVATLFYSASLVMAEVVEGELYQRFENRRFTRMIDQLSGHFILCGYGRIGQVIAEEFSRQRIPYVVIDRNTERVHEVIAAGGMAVAADASREDVLRRVGD